MDDMSDLEIINKLAHIVTASTGERVVHHHDTLFIDNDTSGQRAFNPLTDDALCFQLMVKYKVKMSFLWEEIDGTPHYEAYINEDSSDAQCEKLPNKAICLSIIKADKESNKCLNATTAV